MAALGGARNVSLSELSRASHALGQSLKPVKTTPKRLAAMPMPVIVHMYDEGEQHGHYVVLFTVDKDQYRVINTAYMTLELVSTDDFRRRWSGYALVPVMRERQWTIAMSFGCCVLAGYLWLRARPFRKYRINRRVQVSGKNWSP